MRRWSSFLGELAQVVLWAALVSSCTLPDAGAAPDPPRFYGVGLLSVRHSEHSATLLPDGSVALAGGTYLGSLDRYNPATLNFALEPGRTNTGSIADATLLPNGRVFLFEYTRGEIFDPANGTFARTTNCNLSYSGRVTATLLNDGQVLLVGGSGAYGTTNSGWALGETFNPANGTFTQRGRMLQSRGAHTATRLTNGNVLIVGGNVRATAELYDAATGTFLFTGGTRIAREGHTATLLPNGKVLVVGGASQYSSEAGIAELYDPEGDGFEPTGSLRNPRSGHTATLLRNNTVLICGGQGRSNELNDVEIYDIATGTFAPGPPMNVAREDHTATLLADGTVLLAGGARPPYTQYPDQFYGRSAELYDPQGLHDGPEISVGDVTVVEHTGGQMEVNLTATLSRPSTQWVTATYSTLPESAWISWDFEIKAGVVRIPPGATSGTLSVLLNGDYVHEPEETFLVALSDPGFAWLGRSNGVVTIIDNEPQPELTVTGQTVTEGNQGLTYVNFRLGLSAESEAMLEVAYTTADIEAVAGQDYLPRSGVFTFPPRQTNGYIEVPVIGDLLTESDERFTLNVFPGQYITFSGTQAVARIMNDDGLPGKIRSLEWSQIPSPQFAGIPFVVSLTARDPANNIATNFNGRGSLTVVMSELAGHNLDFEGPTLEPWTSLNVISNPGPYELRLFDVDGDGTATMAFRLRPNHGPPDGISQKVPLMAGVPYTIQCNLALIYESDSILALSGQARIAIDNTVLASRVFNGYVSIYSPYRSNLVATFIPPATRDYLLSITGDRPFPENPNLWAYIDDVKINHALVTPRSTANFTNGQWSGTIALAPEATNVVLRATDDNGHSGLSQPISVEPTADLVLKGQLNGGDYFSSGATLHYSFTISNRGPSSATETTLTVVLPPHVGFISATNSRGLSFLSNGVVTCHFGTLTSGDSGTAMIYLRAGLPGILTNGFELAATPFDPNPANNSLEITNHVTDPLVYISNASGFEGTASPGQITFPVRLSGPSDRTVAVDFGTATNTAIDGRDYIATNGTLVFPPFTTNQTLVVDLIPDDLNEPSRNFWLMLWNPTNAILGNTLAVGDALNDDPAPAITISDAIVVEGDVGTTNALFSVSLSRPSGSTVSVFFTTVFGTANSNDVVATGGSLQFTSGVVIQVISVPVRGNRVNEPDETFRVRLQSPSNATLARSEGIGTILNDDAVVGRLDHFTLSPISSPQYQGLPFGVTVTARDYLNAIITNYTGAPRLYCDTSSGVLARMYDGFEDGDFLGWTNRFNVMAQIATNEAALGVYSLRLFGQGAGPWGRGFERSFDLSAPNQISFYVKASVTNRVTGQLTLRTYDTYTPVYFLLNSNGLMGVTGRYFQTFYGVPYATNVWYKIGLQLDWPRQRLNYLVNDWLVATNVEFNDGVGSATSIVLHSGSSTFPTWWDEFRVEQTNLYVNLSATPTNITFAEGVWQGLVTVGQFGTNAVLRVDDGSEHVGASEFFNVLGGPRLTINVPETITEGVADLFGSISVPVALSNDLTIALTSTDTSELQVPGSVLLPAGLTTVAFRLTVIDDPDLDGSRPLSIAASAPVFLGAMTNIFVHDNERAVLSLSLPLNAIEAARTLTNAGLVTVSAAPAVDVAVQLISTDTNAVRLPVTVPMRAGQTSAVFNVVLLDDRLIEEARDVRIQAQVANWTPGIADIFLQDDETFALSIWTASTSFSEGRGTVTSNAAVRLTGTLNRDLVVSLNSSDVSALQLPPEIIIPAGQTSAILNLTIIDDSVMDGTQPVTLTASALGFSDGVATLEVVDNEIASLSIDPISDGKVSGTPFDFTVRAHDINGRSIPGAPGVLRLQGISINGPVVISTTNRSVSAFPVSISLAVYTPETEMMLTVEDQAGNFAPSNPFTVRSPEVQIIYGMPFADIVWDPFSQRIYGSLPSNAGAIRNQIVVIDPVIGLVERMVPMTNSPRRLALSDDGQFLYVALTETNNVRRLRLPDLSFDLDITVGRDPTTLVFAEDIAVMPGRAHTIAVTRTIGGPYGRDGLAIFDDARQRQTSLPYYDAPYIIDFGASAKELYGSFGGLRRMIVNLSGVTVAQVTSAFSSQDGEIDFDGGRIYLGGGDVVDPGFTLVKKLPTGPVRPDSFINRVSCVASNASNRVELTIFEQNSLWRLGAMTIDAPMPSPTNLIRWGSNGLAFQTPRRSSSSGSIEPRLYLVRPALLTPGPEADLEVQLAGHGLSQAYQDFVYYVTIANRGPNIVSNAAVGQTLPWLRATTSSGWIDWTNAAVRLDPLPPGGTAIIEFISRPGPIGPITNVAWIASAARETELSNNRATNVTTFGFLSRRDQIYELPLATSALLPHPTEPRIYATGPRDGGTTPDSFIEISPLQATNTPPRYWSSSGIGEIAWAPGTNAIYAEINVAYWVKATLPGYNSSGSQYFSGAADTDPATLWGHTGLALGGRDVAIIETNQVITSAICDSCYQLEYASELSRLYAYGMYPPYGFSRFQLAGSQLSLIDTTTNLLAGPEHKLVYSGGAIYTQTGFVIDPEARTIIGMIPGATRTNFLVADAAVRRLFFLRFHSAAVSNATYRIHAYDAKTLQLDATLDIDGVRGTPKAFVLWGADGFAFNTTAGQTFVIRSHLRDDVDLDGLPDNWELAAFGSTSTAEAQPDADPDQDGFSNYREFLAQTDPLNSGSVLRIKTIRVRNFIALTVSTVPNRSYTLEHAPALDREWTTLMTQPSLSATSLTFTVNSGTNPPARFFRVRTP